MDVILPSPVDVKDNFVHMASISSYLLIIAEKSFFFFNQGTVQWFLIFKAFRINRIALTNKTKNKILIWFLRFKFVLNF